MTIHCKLCHCAITSLGPLPGTDSQQVMELMANHLVAKHQRAAVALKEQVALFATCSLVIQYVRLSESEAELAKTLNDATHALINLLAGEAKPVA